MAKPDNPATIEVVQSSPCDPIRFHVLSLDAEEPVACRVDFECGANVDPTLDPVPTFC